MGIAPNAMWNSTHRPPVAAHDGEHPVVLKVWLSGPLDVHHPLDAAAYARVARPGALFGYLAGYMDWFPKAFGFRLNGRWGKIAS